MNLNGWTQEQVQLSIKEFFHSDGVVPGELIRNDKSDRPQKPEPEDKIPKTDTLEPKEFIVNVEEQRDEVQVI